MKIVSAVGEHGGGHAWLDIGMPVHLGMQLVIERDAEKNCFLGPDGWQSQSTELNAVPLIDERRPEALLLGPSIVNCLKDGDYVTISIPGTPFCESDFWPPVPISGPKAQGGGFVGGASPSMRKMPPPKGPVGVTAAAPSSDIPKDGASLSQEQADTGRTEAGKGFLRTAGLVGAALIAAVFLAVGGYFTWQQLPEDAIAGLPERALTAVESVGQGILGGPRHDVAYWNGVLRDAASTPEQLYSSAIDTRDNAETQGLSHEFLYQAALRGNGQAQQDYSRLYDPTVSEATGWNVRKNARTALEFYKMRQDGGDQAAADDIQRVCEFLKPNIFVDADSRTAFDDYCAQ